MTQLPLVTVITPAYNAERFIESAICSVVNQTYPNWELIVVNDGSTDRTEQICRQYEEMDKRIRVITTKNHGVSHARNIGLGAAAGDYIAFLDADDFLALDYLCNLVTALQVSGADVAGAGVISVDETTLKPVKKDSSSYSGKLIDPLVRYDPGVFLAVFYVARAASIRDVYFEEKITNGEDFLFWLKGCVKRELRYQGIQNDGYFYRITANSASKNLTAWAKSQAFILRESWSLNLGLHRKIILTGKICRQLASYYIKRSLNMR